MDLFDFWQAGVKKKLRYIRRHTFLQCMYKQHVGNHLVNNRSVGISCNVKTMNLSGGIQEHLITVHSTP